MGARKWVAGLVSVALLTCQAAAAQVVRPIGLVVAAHKAQLEGAEALQGASVFAPQRMSTKAGGTLSVRVVQARLTLGSESAARISTQDGQLQAILIQGAMRVAWDESSPVELQALGVTIRPQGNQPASAELAIAAAGELLVTSRQGALETSYAGVTQLIPAGASYKAVVTPEEQAQERQGAGRRRRMAPIVWIAIGTATAITLWLLLKDSRESVSPTIP